MMPSAARLAAVVVFAVLGAVVGSFCGALQTRWPAHRTIVAGRSACDHCGRGLGVVELVPILSWLVLRGRCAGCGGRIDPIQPLSEIGGLLVGALAAAVLAGPALWAGALFGWLLLALALLDARHFWLPDALTLPLAGLGAAASLSGIGPPPLQAAWGGLIGFALLWLLTRLYRLRSSTPVMGEGDLKLLGAIGIWTGPLVLPDVLLLAAGGGLVWAAAARLAGRKVERTTQLPFGTMLAAASWPLWLLHHAG